MANRVITSAMINVCYKDNPALKAFNAISTESVNNPNSEDEEKDKLTELSDTVLKIKLLKNKMNKKQRGKAFCFKQTMLALQEGIKRTSAKYHVNPWRKLPIPQKASGPAKGNIQAFERHPEHRTYVKQRRQEFVKTFYPKSPTPQTASGHSKRNIQATPTHRRYVKQPRQGFVKTVYP